MDAVAEGALEQWLKEKGFFESWIEDKANSEKKPRFLCSLVNASNKVVETTATFEMPIFAVAVDSHALDALVQAIVRAVEPIFLDVAVNTFVERVYFSNAYAPDTSATSVVHTISNDTMDGCVDSCLATYANIRHGLCTAYF